MKIADIKKNAEQKMQKSLEALKTDLGKVRTGRAHTGILDHVTVDYYGTPTPVPQVASVTLIDNRTIGVTPWDKKMAGAVEKAIRNAEFRHQVECGLVRLADEVVEPLDREAAEVEVRSHAPGHAVSLEDHDVVPGLGRVPRDGQAHGSGTDDDNAPGHGCACRHGAS